MSEEGSEVGEVEQVSVGEIPYEDLPKPSNSLDEDLISQGLSEVKRTAGKSISAASNYF
jgi:hypothetical protein